MRTKKKTTVQVFVLFTTKQGSEKVLSSWISFLFRVPGECTLNRNPKVLVPYKTGNLPGDRRSNGFWVSSTRRGSRPDPCRISNETMSVGCSSSSISHSVTDLLTRGIVFYFPRHRKVDGLGRTVVVKLIQKLSSILSVIWTTRGKEGGKREMVLVVLGSGCFPFTSSFKTSLSYF